jgi:hypothetical protein
MRAGLIWLSIDEWRGVITTVNFSEFLDKLSDRWLLIEDSVS